jgi:hypothetical protein
MGPLARLAQSLQFSVLGKLDRVPESLIEFSLQCLSIFNTPALVGNIMPETYISDAKSPYIFVMSRKEDSSRLWKPREVARLVLQTATTFMLYLPVFLYTKYACITRRLISRKRGRDCRAASSVFDILYTTAMTACEMQSCTRL